MSQSCARTATAVTFALTVFAATVSADDSCVVVRVYDTGNAASEVRAASMRIAAAIVEDAGIAVDWHDCSDSGDSSCKKSPRTLNLIVRIMPTFVAVPGKAVLRSSVETHESVGRSDVQLGFAVIDPVTRAGTMATIFDDQVRDVARRSGVDRSELLGRALAHEVGHLLLREMSHSPTGLMRAVWTDAELSLNRLEDWVFAPLDRHRLQLNFIEADPDLVSSSPQ